jgi:hypothetical protein
MSVESEAYWQTPVKWLAERTLIAGILIYFNHFNICVCCWKLKLCMTCF